MQKHILEVYLLVACSVAGIMINSFIRNRFFKKD
nr:hypothetical protein [Mucilaginibacter sp. SP1R1]